MRKITVTGPPPEITTADSREEGMTAPIDALAIKATRARFAFLNAKRITREQRCTEAYVSGPEDGLGRDFCWREMPNGELEDWCDGCRARSAALPEIDRLRKEWRRAWSAVQRALAREAKP